jgi:hypothetical protein
VRYFVSGHLDLTREEFDAHYVPALVETLQRDALATFVVGDARGADLMAQEWLFQAGVPVTVYHMLTSPRNNPHGFQTCGGFETDDDRDHAMTAASDRDIAWVRPGRERSGTRRNIVRRLLSSNRD